MRCHLAKVKNCLAKEKVSRNGWRRPATRIGERKKLERKMLVF